MDIIKGNSILFGFLIVIGYLIWKFYLKPIMNEGKPIEPEEEEEIESMFPELPV